MNHSGEPIITGAEGILGGRVLVHVCCGPCAIAPLKAILNGKAEVWGYFHNPNIHPFSEFTKRLEAAKKLASLMSLDLICNEEYRPTEFIKEMKASVQTGGSKEKFPPKDIRCAYCYTIRLESTARTAKERGFDCFTSSLLYSKYQNHGFIKEAGVDLARKYGVPFYYEDFRSLWQEGIDESKAAGLYRQKYCGCIYSKMERYAKKNKAAAVSGR